MTLFSQKGERKKDYNALIGPKTDMPVLDLTPKMHFTDQAHRENLRELEARAASIEAARAELVTERQALARQQDDLSSSNAEISQAFETLQDNADRLETREREFEILRQSFDEDNNRLRDQAYYLRNREEQLDELFTELAQLKNDASFEQAQLKDQQLETVQNNYIRQKDELRATVKDLKETRRRLDENWELLSEAETIRLAQEKTLGQKEWEIIDLTTELDAVRSALGAAEFKASAAEDERVIAQTRLATRLQDDASRQSMTSELKELRSALTDSRVRMEKTFAQNRHLEESLAATQERLVALRDREESTFAENALLAAKNRGLQKRQAELEQDLAMMEKLAAIQKQKKSLRASLAAKADLQIPSFRAVLRS